MAYVFFDDTKQDSQLPNEVLYSLILQLACQSRSVDIYQTWFRILSGQFESRERPFTHLVKISESFERVFLVLDGLDHCDETKQRNDLLPLLHALAKVNIRVFVTSQLHPGDIQRSLQRVTKIDLAAKDEDIKIYIGHTIDGYPRAKRLLEKGRCLDRFVAELTDYAGGM